MSETAPAAPVLTSMERVPAKKRGKKPGGLMGASRKTSSPVSKLLIEALAASQERGGMSLAALKKALASSGYDVERNNSRVKVAIKSLVNKGILVQTKGTGASGSFKLSKKATPEPTKGKVKKSASAETKKLALPKESKSPKDAKTNKRAKKPSSTAKKAVRSGRKAQDAKVKQQRKSPAKARAVKQKAGKPQLTQQRTNSRKAASKK